MKTTMFNYGLKILSLLFHWLKKLSLVALLLAETIFILIIGLVWYEQIEESSLQHANYTQTLDTLFISSEKQSTFVGRRELLQNEGRNSASDIHLRFFKEDAQWKISNLSSTRGLLLTYSDDVEISSSITFLEDGMRLGDDISNYLNNFVTIDKVDKKSLEFSTYKDSKLENTWRVEPKPTHLSVNHLAGSTIVSAGCLSRPSALGQYVQQVKRQIKPESIRTLVRIGGSIDCIRSSTLGNDYLAVSLNDSFFDQFRFIYVEKRGFAAVPVRSSQAYAKRIGDLRPAILRQNDHPLKLESGIHLKSVVVGRTSYAVRYRENNGTLSDVELKPIGNPHRVEGITTGSATSGCIPLNPRKGLERNCLKAPIAAEYWSEQINLGLLFDGPILLSIVVFFILIRVTQLLISWLSKSYQADIDGTEQLVNLLQSLLLSIIATIVFFTMLAPRLDILNHPLPNAAATSSNPVPAAVCWLLACIIYRLGSRNDFSFLLVWLTLILALANYSMAHLGFSSPEMRHSRFFEDSIISIYFMATAVAVASWVPNSLLRKIASMIVPSDGDNIKTTSISHYLRNSRGLKGVISKSVFYIIYVPLRAIINPFILLARHIDRSIIGLSEDLSNKSIKQATTWIIIAPYKVLRMALRAIVFQPWVILINSPMTAILFILLFFWLIAWLVFGKEEGIAGFLQPSEIIKALLVFLISILILSLQRRELGIQISDNHRSDFPGQIGLILILLAMIAVAPVIKSDHSPLLICSLLLGLSVILMSLYHLFTLIINKAQLFVKYGGQKPDFWLSPIRSDHENLFGSSQLISKIIRIVPPKQNIKSFIRRRYLEIISLCVISGIIALASTYGMIIANAPSVSVWLEENMDGNIRTPAIRGRSWVELLTMREYKPNEAYRIEYPDTGLQVLKSRETIAASTCKINPNYRISKKLDDIAQNLPVIPYIRTINNQLDQLSNRVLQQFKIYSGPICSDQGRPFEAEEIAVKIPAIHNDFATTWLYTALGRDGMLLVLASQILLISSMLVIALKAILQSHGDYEQRFGTNVIAYATLGFIILYFLHWGLSTMFSIGFLPVMGQPSTFISAGISHFLFVGAAGIVCTIATRRLSQQKIETLTSGPPQLT